MVETFLYGLLALIGVIVSFVLGRLDMQDKANKGVVCPNCVGNTPEGMFAFKWLGVPEDGVHPRLVCSRCKKTFQLVGKKVD